MPQRLIMSIKSVSASVGIIVGLFGAFQSFAILPYRVTEVEKKAELARLRAEVDHDVIIKMSSDVEYIREQVKIFIAPKNKITLEQRSER